MFQQVAAWFASLSPSVVAHGIRIIVTLAGGFFLVRLLAAVVHRVLMKRATAQRQMIARKIVTYSGAVLITVAVLAELGVQLTALLAGAGIVGIAVGIASQTSVSNIISGVFLISEKPFAVGDVIKVGGTTGIIQSIDLLSIKLRTFDNLFVRIPNEKILSSEVTNVTRFPIRRMDIMLVVPYGVDLGKVQRLLVELARGNRFCLDEPQPVILLSDLKDSGVEVLFGPWFAKEDYTNLRNSIMQEIVERLAAEGIHIASPRRAVYLADGREG